MSTVSASVSASVSAHCKTSVGLDPSHFCSNASVLATSYTIPSRWPLPPIQLVMERMPGTCDNYRGGPACCDIVNFPERLIERQVREVLVSFLTGCTTRPGGCRAADFGGNNGWMSMIMLALGARVRERWRSKSSSVSRRVIVASNLRKHVWRRAKHPRWKSSHKQVSPMSTKRPDDDEEQAAALAAKAAEAKLSEDPLPADAAG